VLGRAADELKQHLEKTGQELLADDDVTKEDPNERRQGELRLCKRRSLGGVTPNGLGLFACEPDAALRDGPFLCSAALFLANVHRAHFARNALHRHKNGRVAALIIHGGRL